MVFTGETGWKEGEVYVGTSAPNNPEPLHPSQARAMGEALIRAADLAEAGTSEVARLRAELAAVDDALREAGVEYPLGAHGVRDLGALLKLAKGDE